MVDMLAIAAAAAWLLVLGLCAAATSRPALRAGSADPGQGLAPERPALVNLGVTRCRLNGAAYSATILDLAARGYLAVTERGPGELWCTVPASSPAEAGLAPSERLVLAGVRALARGEGAPFEALAESCASDVRGRWEPFERAVRAEGRWAGITRPRLSAAAQILLYAGAAGVCALVFAAVHARSHSGLWAPAATALFAFAVPAYWAHALGRQDRLTARGAALGACAPRAAGDAAASWDVAASWGTAASCGTPGPAPASSPAELGQLARAVAAGVPVQVHGASPGLVSGIQPGRGRAGAGSGISGQFARTPRPSAAWSSFGGQWRMVRIGPASFPRMHPAFWLVLGAWLALITYVGSLLPAPAGMLVPAVLAVGSAAAIIGGARGLAAWRARPAETSFQAQVIARWAGRRGDSDDDSSTTYIAVDDGERSWCFDVSGAAFGQLALGDRVAVRASPRSGRLLDLVPGQGGTRGGITAAGQPRVTGAAPGQHWAIGSASARPGPAAAGQDRPGAADGPGPGAGPEACATPPGVPLTAEEVSAAVGRPVRATGFGGRATGAVYRGEGVTVVIAAAEGLLGILTGLARRRGRALPGIGDEAWLLNRDRTVIFGVGGLTGKVTVDGPATRSLPPDVLTRLAATVAGRLPRPARSPGTSRHEERRAG